ncbi:vacuolar protein sorting-associated protein 45 [Angomonas deanei]|uniref:Sec1 family, putative n=1 Tax=Angomonas deanei TaxID=59799 RepID=A0A7G2C355_9TRYP|nr:vacuolar protein sorting-associated protein 45 [Angomonas deanei]CAD2214126.1 Sec1 family, putative [Angomonas deanei]|eukprot:EPY41257.1 vacuolar protein sorting-associated protein 45 [Angomonas deanei]
MSAVKGVVRRNCIEQIWTYLDIIFSKQTGLKVLLCDDTTRNILSVVYSQHQLLRHNIVLVDMLSNKDRYPMKHFSCVIFCRPSASSLASVYQELAEGNFSSYGVFFTYMVEPTILQSLANSDNLQLVSCVEEVYADSVALTEWVCVSVLRPLPLGAPPAPLFNPITYPQWDALAFERVAEAAVSMMLSSNRRPVIRYRGGNTVCQKLAAEIGARMKKVHTIYPDLKAKDSVFVILDRMDDPVTPLLTPWTYEAMIHELIGFQRGNEVVINDPDIEKPEDRVHVLTPNTDAFYNQHRHDNWGQVCIAVSEMVKAYKEMNNFDRNAVSLEEIKNFMTRFPEAKRQSAQVTRHCAVTSQLVGEINGRNLTRLSLLEQDIVSNNTCAEHSRLVLEVVQDPKTDVDDALRVVILYALRYEKSKENIIPTLKLELAQRQCPEDRIGLIDIMLEGAGQDRRAHEIFRASTGHMFKTVAKAVGQFGKDVQNVLTQHTPLIRKLINRVYNGTLAEDKYPVQEVAGCPIPTAQAPFVRGKDIVVLFVGGITFTEAMLLWQINQGQIDNNQESLMNLGKNVSRRFGGKDDSTTADEPPTAKIEARVSLLSTAIVNSKDFLNSLNN